MEMHPTHHVITVKLLSDGFATASVTGDAHEHGHNDPADAMHAHIVDMARHGEFFPWHTAEMRLILA